ncbi:MAG: hypothetical protein JEY79_19135, partial [Pseudodesulfovibrio sp.]|nr:hypothetical protein [Pseudodesulfovibrio sp.]
HHLWSPTPPVFCRGDFNEDPPLDLGNTSISGISLTSEVYQKAKIKRERLKIEYVVQFAISKNDDSFSVMFDGFHLSGVGTDGHEINKDIPEDNMLSEIYENQPSTFMWGIIMACAR